MEDHQLLDAANAARQRFGAKCTKYIGAVTVELIREALRNQGLTVSARDTFILGVPVEVDLILPRPDASCEHGLLYRPEDVLIALEIKNSGVYGADALDHIKQAFDLIRKGDPAIWCAYITLTERKGYKYAATSENIGASTYTLFWHNGSSIGRRYESTGDWERLLADIKHELARTGQVATG
jgi:hypothetical protein